MKQFSMLLIATILLNAGLAKAQNLISNPSFESGMTGYNNLASSPGAATYAISTTNVQQGTNAFSVKVTTLGTNSWDIQTMGPTVSLTVGQSYTLTFYAKSATQGAIVDVLFQNTKYLAQSFTLTTTYTQYSWTFVAQETSPSLRFQFSKSANVNNTIYLDNFNLPTPPVLNTSFDDTTIINTTKTYQTITGLGGGICYYSNWLTAHPNKSLIYNLLFKDLGLTFLRLFNIVSDNTSPNFSDYKEIVSNAKTLLGYTPKILVSSWSAPASLKANGSINGTNQNPPTSAPYPTLSQTNGAFNYGQFSNWWKNSVLTFQQNGIYPDYISMQNEPDWNPTYEGCLFNPTQSSTIAGYPQAVAALRLSIDSITTNKPKILGPEVFGINSNQFQNYVNNFSSSLVDGYCYHLYTGGDFQTPESFNANLAGVGTTASTNKKEVIMSEYIGVTASTSGLDTLSNTINLAWLIHNNLTQANASGYIVWDLIWGDKSSFIGLENPWNKSTWKTTNGYIVEQQYYALKQFTKFIRSGWIRKDATNSSSNFKTSVYSNLNGDSLTLVMINVGNSNGNMKLNLGNFVPTSSAIYQTNGSNLQCSNTGSYTTGTIVSLPARSVTTIAFVGSTTCLTVAPTVTSPVSYCQNATASALKATGTGLKWYTTATGGTASTVTPIPSTTATGTTSYYVSQTLNACEGPRAAISVTVNSLPTITPNVQVNTGSLTSTTAVTVNQGSTVTFGPLPNVTTGWSWIGPNGFTSTLRNPVLSSILPINQGVYTATYTDANSCQASSNITISVLKLQSIPLIAGWNLVSTNVMPTDSSIASLFIGINVQEIKTMDVFWYKGQNTVFNNLNSIESGKGYMVKMNVADTLKVYGKATVNTMPTTPKAGWQLIGCPFQTSTSISTIFNATNATEIKNFNGFWMPNGTLNSISTFEPGIGYFIKK